MVVTAKTLEGLADIRQANLEADIATELASRLGISPEEALEKYYSSPIAGMVAKTSTGCSTWMRNIWLMKFSSYDKAWCFFSRNSEVR